MGVQKHISEGRCAVYGLNPSDDVSAMRLWRDRLHNESGMTTKDTTAGVSAGISLLWNPTTSSCGGSNALSSRKRNSDLKRLQELLNSASTTPCPRPSMIATDATPTQPSAAVAPTRHVHWSREKSTQHFATENARLRQSAKFREIGQTFLLGGNLQQAKIYLAKAEKMLNVG